MEDIDQNVMLIQTTETTPNCWSQRPASLANPSCRTNNCRTSWKLICWRTRQPRKSNTSGWTITRIKMCWRPLSQQRPTSCWWHAPNNIRCSFFRCRAAKASNFSCYNSPAIPFILHRCCAIRWDFDNSNLDCVKWTDESFFCFWYEFCRCTRRTHPNA